MQIQAIHSLDFCFHFHLKTFVGTFILYPNYNMFFLVETNIFESKKNFLVVQSFGPKTNLKQPKTIKQKHSDNPCCPLIFLLNMYIKELFS
jgi:hypothetical protein